MTVAYQQDTYYLSRCRTIHLLLVNLSRPKSVYLVTKHTSKGETANMLAVDSELVARCQGDDIAAYEELVRRHREAVYRVVYAVVGNHDQAEDVVQEAFLHAYQTIRRFDSRRPFAPWLKRIGVNCAVSELRRQERMARAAKRDVAPSYEANPEECAIANDLQAAVSEAVSKLPAQQRTAVMLFSLAEMDLAETAAMMGCTVGTVKTHLHRARQKLRGLLSDYLEED